LYCFYLVYLLIVTLFVLVPIILLTFPHPNVLDLMEIKLEWNGME
jgi:hypothetical protein